VELTARVVVAVALIASAPLWWPPLRRLPSALRARRWRGVAVGLTALGSVGLLALQLVPYGWDRPNPPVTAEPEWDSTTTRDLAARACFACHSNESEWPWYSRLAPGSWLVLRDVEAGRDELNFSEWDREEARDEARDAAREIERGSMPPLGYELAHPDGRLTDSERAALAEGLRRSIGAR